MKKLLPVLAVLAVSGCAGADGARLACAMQAFGNGVNGYPDPDCVLEKRGVALSPAQSAAREQAFANARQEQQLRELRQEVETAKRAAQARAAAPPKPFTCVNVGDGIISCRQ